MEKQLKAEVGNLIKEEIEKNNQTLLQSMQALMEISIQQLKRSSNENADKQLKEIKRLKYSEPHRFKKKANEDQHRFNAKVLDSLSDASDALQQAENSKAQEAIQKGENLLNERQKHILLADKSEYGWATVHEYKQHELADNSEDEKRIFKSELRAKGHRKKTQHTVRIPSDPEELH